MASAPVVAVLAGRKRAANRLFPKPQARAPHRNPAPGRKVAPPVVASRRAAMARVQSRVRPKPIATTSARAGVPPGLLRLFFKVQLHLKQHLLQCQRFAQQPLGLIDRDFPIADRHVVLAHQQRKALRQRHDILIDPA